MKTVLRMKGIILICLFAIFFISCRENIKKAYYDTGELRKEQTYIGKDSAFYFNREYYKNGQLQREFYTLENGRFHGIGKEFYSDGVLKWQGRYNNGYRAFEKLDYHSLRKGMDFSDPLGITPNEPFKFRIYVDKVHPSEYIVLRVLEDRAGNSVGDVEVSDVDNDDFPYTVVLTDEELELCRELNQGNKCDTLLIVVTFFPDTTQRAYKLTDLPAISFSVPIRQ